MSVSKLPMSDIFADSDETIPFHPEESENLDHKVKSNYTKFH